MTVTVERTNAYGLYRAAATVEGHRVEVLALTPQKAETTLRARVRCEDGCGKPHALGEGEARVSRRALGGVYCAACRARMMDGEEER